MGERACSQRFVDNLTHKVTILVAQSHSVHVYFSNSLLFLTLEWLQPTSEDDSMAGKPGAFCKLCKTHIRALHRDLLVHKNSFKHKTKEQSLNRSKQSDMNTFGKFVKFEYAYFVFFQSSSRNFTSAAF